jgi:hypothetical protein
MWTSVSPCSQGKEVSVASGEGPGLALLGVPALAAAGFAAFKVGPHCMPIQHPVRIEA